MSLGTDYLPRWTIAAPVAAWALYAVYAAIGGPLLQIALAAGLFASVLAAVHHAEVIAHKAGEPFGTLLFALAVTAIEIGLIVSIMSAGGPGSEALARDTVFATIMVILNGVVGICLLVGGLRHREQTYVQTGVSAALATLACLAVVALVLPNHATGAPGPYYTTAQLAFVGAASLALYGTFVLVQTVRHRDYFLAPSAGPEEAHAPPPPARIAAISAGLLMVSLVAVVWLSKTLAPSVEALLDVAGAPKAAVGVIIAVVVLLPEGLAAMRAARADRLQTSLNLALGSALATIGLTIPAIAALAIIFGWELALGIAPKDTVLLTLSLFAAALSLSTGRTTIMQGALHLMLFGVFLFLMFVP